MQRISTAFLSLKNSHIFLVLLTGFELGSLMSENLESDALPTEPHNDGGGDDDGGVDGERDDDNDGEGGGDDNNDDDDDDLQEGATWDSEACTVCTCNEGEVQCYQKTCPLCPDGQSHVTRPGQCCGHCETG